MSELGLKTLPEFFEAIIQGRKNFEIRKDDRGGYRVGDILSLREWDGERYTGRSTLVDVTFITSWEQKDGYVVMSIQPHRSTSQINPMMKYRLDKEHTNET